jgi:hypothetical protein
VLVEKPPSEAEGHTPAREDPKKKTKKKDRTRTTPRGTTPATQGGKTREDCGSPAEQPKEGSGKNIEKKSKIKLEEEKTKTWWKKPVAALAASPRSPVRPECVGMWGGG